MPLSTILVPNQNQYDVYLDSVNIDVNEVDENNGLTLGNKSLQLGKVTDTQMNALTPSNGMILYNTTQSKIMSYTNDSWSGTTGTIPDPLSIGRVNVNTLSSNRNSTLDFVKDVYLTNNNVTGIKNMGTTTATIGNFKCSHESQTTDTTTVTFTTLNSSPTYVSSYSGPITNTDVRIITVNSSAVTVSSIILVTGVAASNSQCTFSQCISDVSNGSFKIFITNWSTESIALLGYKINILILN